MRVFEGVKVADECSCSRDKVRGILGGFSAEEIEDSIEDGAIKVSCEFCSKAYEFDPAEFAAGAQVELRSPPRQFTVRDLPGMSSEKAGMSTSNISPRALRIV